jgi:hypothetical protein
MSRKLFALVVGGLLLFSTPAFSQANLHIGVSAGGIATLSEGENPSADFYPGLDAFWWDGGPIAALISIQTASDQGNLAQLGGMYVANIKGSMFKPMIGGAFVASLPAELAEFELAEVQTWGGEIIGGWMFDFPMGDTGSLLIRVNAKYAFLVNADDKIGFEIGPVAKLF